MFVTGLTCCGANAVLDISRREAARRLKNGDIRFILEGEPSQMGQLGKIHPSAPFYAGLLTASADPVRAAALFEAALESPGRRVREAAAQELIPLTLEDEDRALRILSLMNRPAPPPSAKRDGSPPAPPFPLSGPLVTLRGSALYRLGRFDELEELYAGNTAASPWDRALKAAAAPRRRGEPGEAARFFLTETPGREYRWALGEIEALGSALTEAEAAAAAGRIAVSRSSFNEALAYFKIVLEQDERLFTAYPALLGDLGRTFQFTSFQEEGLEILLRWDRELGRGAESPSDDESAGPGNRDIRYRLLYFAGRIRRQMGRQHYAGAAEYFTRALALAPDELQEDACVWYLLHMTLLDKPGEMLPMLRAYAPRWHSARYFSDILDQLARNYTAAREWESLREIFSLIRAGSGGEPGGEPVAKYAWLTGRALEEGYLEPEPGGEAADYFRIILNTGGAPFYYRALAASRLDESLSPMAENNSRNAVADPGEETAFLLGFFNFGAGGFIHPYLEAAKDRLSAGELRRLAEAFAESRRWADSIRTAEKYMTREDYQPERRDLELYYPRPYLDLIEKRAREAEIPVEIFYGLIRTESSFIPDAGSRAGAGGLAQLMPATALETAGRVARQGGPDYIEEGKVNLKDPTINVHLGAAYLNYLMARMDSPLLALLAYNGGMGRVRRWRAAESNLPEDLFLETIDIRETREYGKKVLGAAAAYGYLYYNMTMEAVVADIFK
jgi:soluble lytic murein transglycosylase